MKDEKRLEFALERMTGENWRLFERFASAFFVSEFPSLRTMANAAGDEGRDAELFEPEGGHAHVVLQYSVAADWRTKIRRTIKRLEEVGSPAKILIYATSQTIGAMADELKSELAAKIFVDVRDRSYFLERFRLDDARVKLAEELAKELVDPLLESRGLVGPQAKGLTSGQSHAALIYLELQWADSARDKGLTRLTFEALVKYALRDTSLTHTIDLAEVYRRVCDMVPEHDVEFAVKEVDKALRKLTGTVIRHYPKDEKYCLSNEEVERIRQRLVELEIEDAALNGEISEVVRLSYENVSETRLNDIVLAARAVIEEFLMNRGELFVGALASGQLTTVSEDSVQAICDVEIRKRFEGELTNSDFVRSFVRVCERLLVAQPPRVQAYLRQLSDAYTLRAFLRRTPDVQEAVRKMFSYGEIWLDTTIVLPLLGERVLPRGERSFRKLIASAKSAGLTLRVTPGVIEEVERHVNRAKLCSTYSQNAWKGPIPYLLAIYTSRGMDAKDFGNWTSAFAGEFRPQDDIAEFILSEFGITRSEIVNDASQVNPDLRMTVQSLWQEIHIERRQRRQDGDSMIALRMAEHDTENYVGVIGRRNRERDSALGYTSWWLTLDHQAFAIASKIPNHLLGKYDSPVMSADFLANYLAIGPLRRKAQESGEMLPVSLDFGVMEGMSRDLFELARDIRNLNSGQSEVVIRRQVRDGLDKARRKTGEVHERGLTID